MRRALETCHEETRRRRKQPPVLVPALLLAAMVAQQAFLRQNLFGFLHFRKTFNFHRNPNANPQYHPTNNLDSSSSSFSVNSPSSLPSTSSQDSDHHPLKESLSSSSSSSPSFQCKRSRGNRKLKNRERKQLFGTQNGTEFTRKGATWIPAERGALLMHLGKAGGGTIASTILQHWGYKMEQCHGNAKNCFSNPDEGYVDGWDERLLFLTIRDPIDRFVSAFNWDVKQTCRPQHNDTRQIATKSILAVQYPDEYCKLKNNFDPIYRTTGPLFESSAEKMAQDLCTEDPAGTGDTLLINPNSTAYVSMNRRLPHVRGCTLSTYLGEEFPDTYNWKDNTDRLIPIVMEKGFDLVEASKDSIYYASKIRNITSNVFQEDELFGIRRRLAMCPREEGENSDKQGSSSNKTAMITTPSKTRHSSALSKDGREKYLSERSQRCLATYYQRDYEILQELLDLQVCKSEQCTLAIQSILNRRRNLLLM